MKYNYPIKYATMPIIEQIGWSHGLNELERNYGVVCYIVSKCYLLSDKTKYKEDGRSVKEYEVVFPYQRELNGIWKRTTMSYACINPVFVENVYDSYEEALEISTQKNKELCEKTWICLPYTKDLEEQISKKIEEFNNKLSRYKILEQQILINTSDLEQSNVKKLNNLIGSNKGKIRVLSSNLYQYLKCYFYSKFIVYSISQEQYDKLTTLADNQDIFDASSYIKNVSPILYKGAKDQKILVIDQNGNALYYINEWEHLRNDDEQKKLYIELNDIDEEIECLFTTETLEDILLSFKDYEYINLDKIQSPILERKLSGRNNR